MNGARAAWLAITLVVVLGNIALAAGADIVADVRAASDARNFALAEREIQSYRSTVGDRKSTRLNSSHSLHDALPIWQYRPGGRRRHSGRRARRIRCPKLRAGRARDSELPFDCGRDAGHARSAFQIGRAHV